MIIYYNVEPLRSQQEITAFVNYARNGTHGERNALLILIGLNTGLRMSDILNLKVVQVRYQDVVQITEKKTKKTSDFTHTSASTNQSLYRRFT
ncbi:integrase/recombinase [Lactiplantibacillus plantarum]|nr:integrase/recombinase [Lactiplantibacillus plantarum]